MRRQQALADTVRSLKPTDRALVMELDRLSKGHLECWAATRTLADAIQCCERTVRSALARLAELGVVEIVRDYTIRSRRRIVLAWRRCRLASEGLLHAQVTADMSSQSRQQLPPDPPPPLEPPYRSPEGQIEKTTDEQAGPNEPGPGESAASVFHREALREVQASFASEAFGEPVRPEWLDAQAAKYGDTAVDTAVRLVGRDRRAGKAIRNPFGYAVAAMRNWSAEGGASEEISWSPPPEVLHRILAPMRCLMGGLL
jgi:hypothetical protein